MKIIGISAKNIKTAAITTAVLIIAIIVLLRIFMPATVSVLKPAAQNLTAEAYGTGTVEARIVTPVSSKVTGTIISVHADQGDIVRRGQVLARLDSREALQQEQLSVAQLERAGASLQLEKAQLHKAEVTLEQAVKNAGRYKMLADQALVAPVEAEQYETAAQTARADLLRAKAAIAAAGKEQLAQQAAVGTSRAKLSDLVITAPVDGVIISRNQEAGATVMPGAAIFRIADPSTVWVRSNIDEARLAGVKPGRKADISLRSMPGVKLAGTVARVSRESDRVTEELAVEVAFDAPVEDFRLGEQAEVRIQSATRSMVIAIPEKAVVHRNSKSGVWLVKDNRLQFRQVQTGIRDPSGMLEITAGLSSEDILAIAEPEKMSRFKEKQRVRIMR